MVDDPGRLTKIIACCLKAFACASIERDRELRIEGGEIVENVCQFESEIVLGY